MDPTQQPMGLSQTPPGRGHLVLEDDSRSLKQVRRAKLQVHPWKIKPVLLVIGLLVIPLNSLWETGALAPQALAPHGSCIPGQST